MRQQSCHLLHQIQTQLTSWDLTLLMPLKCCINYWDGMEFAFQAHQAMKASQHDGEPNTFKRAM